MASQVVKFRRQTLQACMTCPLCHSLFNDATTISLCLHTFCRKCIYEKFSDEEVDSCPVCNIDLGCLPLEKLRPDHNLQDIRAKIFPFKKRKMEAPENVPSTSLPVKRKERSLSSLVVSAPKVSLQTGFTGKRMKTGTRKTSALRGCNFSLEETIKKEETYTEDNLDFSMAELSRKHRPNEDTEHNTEPTEWKVDLWTPLNCLVEAANRTKSRSNSQGISLAKLESPTTPHGGLDLPKITTKSEPTSAIQSELHMPKIKNKKDNGQKIKFGDDRDLNILLSRPLKCRRKSLSDGQKRAASEICASAQVMFDGTMGRCRRKNNPIWFSLVASEDQKGDVPLPQISACCLRIKDGTVPVLLIQKYLVKKLNLASESEVEIMCRGQPVMPTLELHKLVDLWFRTASTSKKIPASVGSSAKDFVMVLSYCRKPLPP